MSLATLRAHIWKGGNDVVLHYKANGRKELPKELPQSTVPQPIDPEGGERAAEVVEGEDGFGAPTGAPSAPPAPIAAN